MKARPPSKPNVLGARLPGAGPRAGEPDVGLSGLTPVGEPLRSNYSPVCGSPTWGYGIWLYHESTPPARLTVVPSLVVEDLFW